MNVASDRALARRLVDRIVCLRRGHAWETTMITLGGSSLLSTDCVRCGRAGPIHGTAHRSVEINQPRGGRTVTPHAAGSAEPFTSIDSASSKLT